MSHKDRKKTVAVCFPIEEGRRAAAPRRARAPYGYGMPMPYGKGMPGPFGGGYPMPFMGAGPWGAMPGMASYGAMPGHRGMAMQQLRMPVPGIYTSEVVMPWI